MPMPGCTPRDSKIIGLGCALNTRIFINSPGSVNVQPTLPFTGVEECEMKGMFEVRERS